MAATSDPEGLVSWKKVIEGEPSDVVPLDPLLLVNVVISTGIVIQLLLVVLCVHTSS